MPLCKLAHSPIEFKNPCGLIDIFDTYFHLKLNMAWQQKVASWVVPLLTELVIPDDAGVATGTEFATLDGAASPVTFEPGSNSAEYPGLIPDYSVQVNAEPTTGGLNYVVKALKAVGFYGVVSTVVSFDPEKINRWTFPLTRRNFGFCALSRNITVSYDGSIHYERQFHIDEAVLSLLTSYKDSFNPQNLFNSSDKIALNTFSCYTYPTVRLRIGFLPIWEVWAITYFQGNE